MDAEVDGMLQLIKGGDLFSAINHAHSQRSAEQSVTAVQSVQSVRLV